jgi:hypothetical protein
MKNGTCTYISFDETENKYLLGGGDGESRRGLQEGGE